MAQTLGKLRLVSGGSASTADATDGARAERDSQAPLHSMPVPSGRRPTESTPDRDSTPDFAPLPEPYLELDDAQLVALVRSQDVRAFEALYRRHSAFIFNLAARIQGSVLDIEDLVHDAFLKAHQQLSTLREPGMFRHWLGSVAVRLVRTRLRRRRLLGSLGLLDADPVDLDAISSTEAGPELRAQLAQVYALLQTMPTDDRIAWTLRYVESHQLEDVAELTECSLATVKRRIQRAQTFLARHFVSPFAEEES